MSIHEFYLQFVSAEERSPLFAALRRLSSLGNTNGLIHQLVATGWPSWDSPPQGSAGQAVNPA